MANRLADAISPYLRAHADNPVDWFPWGAEAFAEARRRDVPVMVSIGYATCHWCHVMARESFSDPATAAELNERFVAIKVDREEHPDVDAAYLSAASAFTGNLGWPLTVFATPEGRAFFARDLLPAGAGRRAAPRSARCSTRCGMRGPSGAPRSSRTRTRSRRRSPRRRSRRPRSPTCPTTGRSTPRSRSSAEAEDPEFGGFGDGAEVPGRAGPRLPARRAHRGHELAARTLERMAASPLRDAVDGGFFRYATRRDWSEPHYERMLYDNALLLDAYARAWQQTGADWAERTADGVASFLLGVLRRPSGGFASAQDSESTIDGARVEGTYYTAPAGRARPAGPAAARREGAHRAGTGSRSARWLAPGRILDRPAWIAAAREAADVVLAPPPPRRTARCCARRSATAASEAGATLEDYGGLAGRAAGAGARRGRRRPRRRAARDLVDLCLDAAGRSGGTCPFETPGRRRPGARSDRARRPRRPVRGRLPVRPLVDGAARRTPCT